MTAIVVARLAAALVALLLAGVLLQAFARRFWNWVGTLENNQ